MKSDIVCLTPQYVPFQSNKVINNKTEQNIVLQKKVLQLTSGCVMLKETRTRRRRILKKLAHAGEEQTCCLTQGITTNLCMLHVPNCDKNRSRADGTCHGKSVRQSSSLPGGPNIRILMASSGPSRNW